MLFNSTGFAIFFVIVFFCYWFLTSKNLKLQNILLFVASYYFYASWDYRFLFLLAFSTLLDYYTGIKMADTSNKSRRKFWLILSVSINLGFLGIFKYYNFFVSSFADGLQLLGAHPNFTTLNVILPIGISFYTFHGLSYVLDIYKDRIKPERNFIDYSVFVCFFPLLVAGPIERATHLLPQVKKVRHFNYLHVIDGLRQILWGLFQKVVIADNCAEYVNLIFNHSGIYSGSTHVIGAILFAFQIYCDFSGYSNIALGVARLLGIELLRNFAFPYFSRDIAEFWRRWHISLTTWFRDYLYIPLGGSKGGIWMKIKNIFIIFLVSGFWHGANWTFIIWGILNAIYFLPLMLLNKNRNNLETIAQGKYLPGVKEFLSMILTFSLTVFAWIFFRAKSVGDAFKYISEMFSKSLFTMPRVPVTSILTTPFMPGAILFVMLIGFIMIEWFGRENAYAIEKTGLNWPRSIRWCGYYALILLIFVLSGSKQQFIYFQF